MDGSIVEAGVGKAEVEEFFLAHVRIHLGPLQAFLEREAKHSNKVVGVLFQGIVTSTNRLRLILNFGLRLLLHFSLHLWLDFLLHFLFRLGLSLHLLLLSTVAITSPSFFQFMRSLFPLLSGSMAPVSELLLVGTSKESTQKAKTMMGQIFELRRDWESLSVGFNRRFTFFINDCEDMDWSLFESLDFEEGVRMVHSCLTSLTEIEV
jgi:hypothetical protein